MVSFAPTLRPTRFKRIEAWYRRSRSQLEGVVRWLGSGDVCGWELQTQIAEQCATDIVKMARPLPTTNRRHCALMPAYSHVAARMNAAKPHAKATVDAMRERRRAAALESGKAALAEM
jgi:hypothetical protein